MHLLDQLSLVAKAYCDAVGLSRARVATIIFDHGAKFDLIDQGRDINTRTFEKAMGWFSDNWPETIPWPVEVTRPDRPSIGAGVDRPTPIESGRASQ